MRFLRTNTATRITVGPFFDKTDGVTPETALTVTNCKLTLVVDDAGVPTLVLDTNPTASGGANDMVHITNDDAGLYDLELAAGNVNYLGRAMLTLTDAANHCPVFHEFMILPAAVYDYWLSTGVLPAASINNAAFAADTGMQTIRSNTAQAGAAQTITLDASASATDDFYNGCGIYLTGGTGAGQFRYISDYVGSTKVATVNSVWVTNPASGTTFAIVPAETITPTNVNIDQIAGSSDAATRLGAAASCIVYGTVAAAATTTSIPASSISPSGANDPNQYIGLVMKFRGDTTTQGLRGEGRIITGFNDSNDTFTTDPFSQAPASGDLFVIN